MRDADLLLARQHAQPHGYLGAHSDNGSVVVRAFRPAAAHVTVAAGSTRAELEQVHPGGVFEGSGTATSAVIPNAALNHEWRYSLTIQRL